MSTKYRLDGRTREVGSHNISDYTRREIIVGKIISLVSLGPWDGQRYFF